MALRRAVIALVLVVALLSLAGSVYAWPRNSKTLPPPTATVIIEHWVDPPPSRTPTGEGPPAAYLRSAEGREVRGGLGSSCWAGRCVDVELPVSNRDPFFLVASQGYSIRFDGEQPSKTYEDWVRVDANATGTPFDSGRTWNNGYSAGGTDTPTTSSLYLLLVEAAWPGGRDASYAFFVQLP